MSGDSRTTSPTEPDKSSPLPGPIGDDRDRDAEARDHRAEELDHASETRDERGEARDQRAQNRDAAARIFDPAAAADRAAASSDRQGAAIDRLLAADDREASAADRVISAQDRAISSIDEGTGAYRRDAGTLEMEREMARATRTDQPMVLAFVDVDGLKLRNDSMGHAAGDELLRATVSSIRTHLRSYDLVVRFGGDEFVCVLIDMPITEAAKRFQAVNSDLAASVDGSITVGLAELRTGDSLESLIARADAALYKERTLSASGSP
ncbi:MAG: diguanylate cyclase [Actinomycetota bacterium]|nr:diguanylate cyclase [Actinomycetota bacterium]